MIAGLISTSCRGSDGANQGKQGAEEAPLDKPSKGKPHDGRLATGDDNNNAASTAMPTTVAPPQPTNRQPNALAALGKHMWSRRLGGLDRDSARAVALDKSGNIYIGGDIQGEVTIAGNKMVADDVDAIIIKLKPDGTPIWARHFGGPGPDLIEDIAIDTAGHIVVSGSFADKLQIGSNSIESRGSDDGFVAKFDSSGKRLWAKRFGDIDTDNIPSVTVDNDGNSYASATFKGFVTLGKTRFESGGHEDAYLIALDTEGQFRWVQQLRGRGKDYAREVVTDSTGAVFWVAEFSRRAVLGDRNLVSAGNRDVMLSKLSSTGTVQWAYSFGGLADDSGYGLAVDSLGEVVVTGAFSESISVGSLSVRSTGEDDAYVAKFAADGTPRWLKSFGTKTEDVGKAVATDRFGNVFATGWFRGHVDFGGGKLDSVGEKDVFLVKLSANGEHLWSRRFGGKQVDYGMDLATTDKHQAILVGVFYLTANFGGDDLVADSGKARIPNGEMFAVKLTP